VHELREERDQQGRVRRTKDACENSGVAGSARVLDFGIARAIRADRSRFDPGSIGALTQAYASREMLEGEPPDFRDDVYGLACVVYELLTGNHPFAGRSAVEACEQRMAVAPVRGLSAAQNAALVRGLAFYRAQRVATVEDFANPFGRQESEKPRRSAGLRPVWIALGAILAGAVLVSIWWLQQTKAPMAETASETADDRQEPATGTQQPLAHELGSTFVDCQGCPSMTVLPGGTFRMSSSREEPGRAPNEFSQRLVHFARPFAISRFPVTRREFRSFLEQSGRTPSAHCVDANAPQRRELSFKDPGFPQSDDHPAVCVSADDAIAYADWINRTAGKPLYRLPTEAEWEYAARAGARTAFPWGDTEEKACRYGDFADLALDRAQHAAARAPCADGYAYTAPVGSFAGNAWNLEDMVGNVRQWTMSCLPANTPHLSDEADAWNTCDNASLAVRGAGFATALGSAATRFAARTDMPRSSNAASNDVGFRLVRAL
jgi:formylglycine-generating enzyme required for sulfatase activity